MPHDVARRLLPGYAFVFETYYRLLSPINIGIILRYN
jgi:hypothetical protein